jgi:hypothetical protein
MKIGEGKVFVENVCSSSSPKEHALMSTRTRKITGVQKRRGRMAI